MHGKCKNSTDSEAYSIAGLALMETGAGCHFFFLIPMNIIHRDGFVKVCINIVLLKKKHLNVTVLKWKTPQQQAWDVVVWDKLS